jgi:hypothetical protein
MGRVHRLGLSRWGKTIAGTEQLILPIRRCPGRSFAWEKDTFCVWTPLKMVIVAKTLIE